MEARLYLASTEECEGGCIENAKLTNRALPMLDNAT